jgi:hypothetical protein
VGRLYGPASAIAPEVLAGQEYDFPADVYAYGVFGWEVVKFWMRQCQQESLPLTLVEILCRCMVASPAERPKMGEVHWLMEDLFGKFITDLESVEFTSDVNAEEMVAKVRSHRVTEHETRTQGPESLSW